MLPGGEEQQRKQHRQEPALSSAPGKRMPVREGRTKDHAAREACRRAFNVGSVVAVPCRSAAARAAMLARAALAGKPASSRLAPRLHAALSSAPASAARARACSCHAAYPGSQTRITRAIQNIPRDVDRYFQGNFFRRTIWCTISFCVGFYAANMVSLAFGALAINDVVAAVTSVAVYEVISNAFYKAWPRPALWLIFANFFKVGVTTAFIADAMKLGS